MAEQVRYDLGGRVAIVTGASSGLGVAFARGLAAAGAHVVLGARRVDRLEELRAELGSTGPRALAVATDVTDPEACTALVRAAMDGFGRVDLLVNNAGVSSAVPATRERPDDFRRVVDVNLHGSYWMAQACGRVMLPGACIVNVGSVLGQTTAGLPQAAYAASKAAIIGLTRDLAQQWSGRKGIRVNAIAPGFFATEMTDEYQPGYLAAVLSRVPAGRVGETDEVVSVLLFLASDASSYVTGVVLPVDGGLLTG